MIRDLTEQALAYLFALPKSVLIAWTISAIIYLFVGWRMAMHWWRNFEGFGGSSADWPVEAGLAILAIMIACWFGTVLFWPAVIFVALLWKIATFISDAVKENR